MSNRERKIEGVCVIQYNREIKRERDWEKREKNDDELS